MSARLLLTLSLLLYGIGGLNGYSTAAYGQNPPLPVQHPSSAAAVVSPATAGSSPVLSWQYYAYGGLYETGNSWTLPGSGGTFCKFCGVSYFKIDADSSSITFNYSVSDISDR